jgi:hypothetical protein
MFMVAARWQLKALKSISKLFLVLLVNDSEYSQSAGAKPIRPHSCIYLALPLVRCCCCGVVEIIFAADKPTQPGG